MRKRRRSKVVLFLDEKVENCQLAENLVLTLAETERDGWMKVNCEKVSMLATLRNVSLDVNRL